MATGRVLANEEKYVEISVLVIMRLRGFCPEKGKKIPVHKATWGIELNYLLFFSCH